MIFQKFPLDQFNKSLPESNKKHFKIQKCNFI